MATIRAQQEASDAERDHIPSVLGFNKSAENVMDNNHISNITHLINTKRPTYDALVSAHRGEFTIIDVEQLETFNTWMSVYTNNGGRTDWSQELNALPLDKFVIAWKGAGT